MSLKSGFFFFVFLFVASFLFAQVSTVTTDESDQPVGDQTGYHGAGTNYKADVTGKLTGKINQPTQDVEETEKKVEPAKPLVLDKKDEKDPIVAYEFHYETATGRQTITRTKVEFGEDFSDVMKANDSVPPDWKYIESNILRKSGARS